MRNLTERIAEAKDNGRHGEVEGLTVSLNAAAIDDEHTALDQQPRPLTHQLSSDMTDQLILR